MRRRYDPKRIADSLRDLGDEPLIVAPPDDSETPKKSGSPDALAQSDLSEESFVDYMEKMVLPAIESNVHINSVARGTRFAFLKRIIHRALRIVSGKQVSYNYYTGQAVRCIVDHLGDMAEVLRNHDAKISQVSIETGKRLDELWDDLTGRIEAQRSELARLSERVHAGMQARLRQSFRVFQTDKDHTAPYQPLESDTMASLETDVPEPPSEEVTDVDETGYLAFEEIWRGSPDHIRQCQEEHVRMLRPYIEKLELKKQLVLDVGCGPGHFLEALIGNGINCIGVDINRAAVVEARKKGLTVEWQEASNYLSLQPDNRFGVITALQVVEHLSSPVLRRLTDLIHDKLAPGGIAMFETLNPATFAAYRWFLLDLTHERLMMPETLRFMCECAGLEHVETRLIHPVADHERLSETGTEAEKLNLRRLNETLFGNQDYVLLARKPLGAEEGAKA